MLETVLTGLSDTYPKTLRKHKTLFTAAACAFLFLLSVIFTTRVCPLLSSRCSLPPDRT